MNRRIIIGGAAAAVAAGAGYSYFSMGSMTDYEAMAERSREKMAKEFELRELALCHAGRQQPQHPGLEIRGD